MKQIVFDSLWEKKIHLKTLSKEDLYREEVISYLAGYLTDRGDSFYHPKLIPEDFLTHHQKKGWKYLPSKNEIFESKVFWSDGLGFPKSESKKQFWNSKYSQAEWKRNSDCMELKPRRISNWEEIGILEPPFVLKKEFSLSGNGNLVFENKPIIGEEDRIQKWGYPLEAESWCDRILDFSTLWDLEKGRASLIGVTRMTIGKQGRFKSSTIGPGVLGEWEKEILDESKNCVLSLLETFEDWNQYEGAFGLDGFVYKSKGKTKIQPMSELNARYTLGRFHHDFRKIINFENSNISIFGISHILDKKNSEKENWITPKFDVEGKQLDWGFYWREDAL
jgi:hypothetical protein